MYFMSHYIKHTKDQDLKPVSTCHQAYKEEYFKHWSTIQFYVPFICAKLFLMFYPSLFYPLELGPLIKNVSTRIFILGHHSTIFRGYISTSLTLSIELWNLINRWEIVRHGEPDKHENCLFILEKQKCKKIWATCNFTSHSSKND